MYTRIPYTDCSMHRVENFPLGGYSVWVLQDSAAAGKSKGRGRERGGRRRDACGLYSSHRAGAWGWRSMRQSRLLLLLAPLFREPLTWTPPPPWQRWP